MIKVDEISIEAVGTTSELLTESTMIVRYLFNDAKVEKVLLEKAFDLGITPKNELFSKMADEMLNMLKEMTKSMKDMGEKLNDGNKDE